MPQGPFFAPPSQPRRPAPPNAGQQVVQGYRDLQQDQWGQAMQGMRQGQQYLDPAWNYANQQANRGPGEFQQAYGSLYAQMAGPGQTGGAWDYTRGQLQQDPNAQGAYGDLQGYLKNPSAISDVYGSYRGPQSTSAAYGQARGTFQGPGMGQGMADQFTGQMRGPGAGEQWYQANQGAYAQPTSAAKLYENNFGGYGDASNSEGYLLKYQQSQNKLDQQYAGQLAARDRLGNQSATEKAAGEIGGIYNEAGNLARASQGAETYAAQNLPGIQREGQHEQFVRSAMEGDNPYIRQLEEEGMASLNQQMAKRGHFNSGGANVALGKFAGQMGAERFRDMAEMTKGAQQMGLARGQQGLGYAQASDTGRLARGEGVRGEATGKQALSGQMEGERFNRESLSAQIMQDVTKNMMGDRDFDMRSAGQADDMKLRRLQGRDALAGQNDRTNLDYLNAGQGAAFRAQGAGEDRMGRAYGMGNQQDTYNLGKTMASMDAAGQNDRMYLDDYQMRGNLAGQMDTTGLGRMMSQIQGAGQLDATQLARLGQYMQGAGQADDVQMRRTMGQGALAGQMQDYGRQNMMDTYGMLQGAGGAQAGNIANYYGTGMNAYGQHGSSALNAQMDMYLMDQQRKERQRSLWQTIAPIAGAAGGFFLGGGPQGAYAGYQAGRIVSG